MSSEPASIDSTANSAPLSDLQLSDFEQLCHAREIIKLESRTLAQLADRLDHNFCAAVKLLCQCRGSVIVSGMGKAGLVGQKIMATLASTGTRAHCLHPAEAVHGDLGRVRDGDVVLMLSQSGETEEVVRLLPMLAEAHVPIIAITAGCESTLGRAATVVIELGRLEEAGALRLAPSTSTTAMLALGDALALVASQMRGFRREDFARFHPGGSLGQRLSRVEQLMRGLDCCRVADQRKTVREVLVNVSLPGRRTGAIMLVDAVGKLSGIFTDSDLARLFEQRRDPQLDVPISSVMTAEPLSARLGTLVTDAVDTMARRKISELPVVDPAGRPAGLIDITDVVGLMPKEEQLVEDGFESPADDPCRVFPQPRADSEEAA
ncbi:MAG: KpsF/GutQ family sugar-phosphate isomerase [Planctomycetota bacterium]|nr:KpsF/GutQ family sugar-phosphate isomerase [Planctomycetota bacterium]